MEIKLFGLKIRVEIVILCMALGFILGAHLFCSCLKINLSEGFELLDNLGKKHVPLNKPLSQNTETGVLDSDPFDTQYGAVITDAPYTIGTESTTVTNC